MKYLTVDYMYRSGFNWKLFSSVSFKLEKEEGADHMVNEMESLLGEHFIAHQVDFPEVFDWVGDILDDHCYHEVCSVTLKDARDGEVHCLSAEAFIKKYRNIVWEVFVPYDRMKGECVA